MPGIPPCRCYSQLSQDSRLCITCHTPLLHGGPPLSICSSKPPCHMVTSHTCLALTFSAVPHVKCSFNITFSSFCSAIVFQVEQLPAYIHNPSFHLCPYSVLGHPTPWGSWLPSLSFCGSVTASRILHARDVVLSLVRLLLPIPLTSLSLLLRPYSCMEFLLPCRSSGSPYWVVFPCKSMTGDLHACTHLSLFEF